MKVLVQEIEQQPLAEIEMQEARIRIRNLKFEEKGRENLNSEEDIQNFVIELTKERL